MTFLQKLVLQLYISCDIIILPLIMIHERTNQLQLQSLLLSYLSFCISGSHCRDPETAVAESVAASKTSRLKEFFKNHRLRKEREEEEMMRNVKSPKIKMVFKGHRNSRTMVSCKGLVTSQ